MSGREPGWQATILNQLQRRAVLYAPQNNRTYREITYGEDGNVIDPLDLNTYGLPIDPKRIRANGIEYAYPKSLSKYNTVYHAGMAAICDRHLR